MTDHEIREHVRKLLTRNVSRGHSDAYGTDYCTIQPSPDTYPFQYFWDTCLHVFILTALDEHELAKQTLKSLFGMQSDDGFVGHMLYWDCVKPAKPTDVFQSRYDRLYGPHMTALVQPPLAAQALQRIWYGDKDRAYLEEMTPKLIRYYDWLRDNRDFDGDGLLTIITMFESGMDWKPTMDPVLDFRGVGNDELFKKAVEVDRRNFMHDYDLGKIREEDYFLVKEVAFNTIYIQNLDALAGLCREIGRTEDAGRFEEHAQQASASLQEKMYDGQTSAYWDLRGPDDTPIKILTPTIFFPIVLDSTSQEQARAVIERHLFNDDEFNARYPIPSVAKNEPSYDPTEAEYLWRGPTWVFYNWFVYQCLFYKDFKDEAERLRESIRELIDKSGFREYYHPETGEGYGAKDFTWSGVVVDMLNLKE